MNLQLRKFKPETISDDRVCVFIGKRNTGKSTLVKDIMFHKRHLPAGIVLSGTEEGNHFYSDFIPDLFIYGDYDRDAIERVMARQRKLVGSGKTQCGAFMLLDDCMYDSKFLKDTCIRQCFMNGRHWKIFFMHQPFVRMLIMSLSSGRTSFRIERNFTNPFLVSSLLSICSVRSWTIQSSLTGFRIVSFGTRPQSERILGLEVQIYGVSTRRCTILNIYNRRRMMPRRRRRRQTSRSQRRVEY